MFFLKKKKEKKKKKKRKSDLNKLRNIAFVIVRENAETRWSGRSGGSGGPWRWIYGSGISWVRNWMGQNQRREKRVKRRNGDMVQWDQRLLHVAAIHSVSQALADQNLRLRLGFEEFEEREREGLSSWSGEIGGCYTWPPLISPHKSLPVWVCWENQDKGEGDEREAWGYVCLRRNCG